MNKFLLKIFVFIMLSVASFSAFAATTSIEITKTSEESSTVYRNAYFTIDSDLSRSKKISICNKAPWGSAGEDAKCEEVLSIPFPAPNLEISKFVGVAVHIPEFHVYQYTQDGYLELNYNGTKIKFNFITSWHTYLSSSPLDLDIKRQLEDLENTLLKPEYGGLGVSPIPNDIYTEILYSKSLALSDKSRILKVGKVLTEAEAYAKYGKIKRINLSSDKD
jgi:hypothetical protein